MEHLSHTYSVFLPTTQKFSNKENFTREYLHLKEQKCWRWLFSWKYNVLIPPHVRMTRAIRSMRSYFAAMSLTA